METALKNKIDEIEKEIPNLDVNDKILDFELNDYNDFDEIKNHMEKKHKGIIITRLKIGKRKCVSRNYIEKILNV